MRSTHALAAIGVAAFLGSAIDAPSHAQTTTAAPAIRATTATAAPAATTAAAAKPAKPATTTPEVWQTMEDKLQVSNEIIALAGDALVGGSLTPQEGPPIIQLGADRQELAEQLDEKYGRRVQLILGVLPFPYPWIDVPGWPKLGCRDVAENRLVNIAPSAKTIRVNSGGTFRGLQKFVNRTGTPFRLNGMWVADGIVTPIGKTNAIANFGPRALPATVVADTIVRTGKSVSQSVEIATSSCDPEIGWALPPGEYSVHFLLVSSREVVRTKPVRLVITNAPPPPITSTGVTGLTLPPTTVP